MWFKYHAGRKLRILDRMNLDADFMTLALIEAQKGYGKVSPNPLVGAVLVKNNKIISTGYHKYFGGNHAEIEALNNLSEEEIIGATLYVTLEPCCHHNKKTPPCVEFLITKKLKRIIICNIDPNPEVSGNGVKLLRDGGIEVEHGLLEEEGKKINKVFFKFIKEKIPYVHLKYAQTLDGKIASQNGDSKWISDQDARKEVHHLRLGYDAILVGKNTVNSDDPLLTIRYGLESEKACPYRIMVGDLKGVNINSKLFNDEYVCKTIIICGDSQSNRNLAAIFKSKKIEVLFVLNCEKKISTLEILKILASKNISSVLVEGGAQIISQFLAEKTVDKITSYIAPKIIGSGKDFFNHQGIQNMSDALTFINPVFRSINNQIVMDAEGVME
jgi:diaminohydroxyphosphoribosylaminopyrimidine deaminase / 5-amino-6-(5-phosphoribosylamino)uracil reductase